MKADRLLSLPPYLFEELENRLRAAGEAGRDVIDLSVGDPDLTPPESLLRRLTANLDRTGIHRYPPQRGSLRLKAAIRRYLERRCGVVPADDQILVLIGSKEGIAHLPWAVCNPGDVIALPNPGYPVYSSAASFAGCRTVEFALTGERDFQPDPAALDAAARDGARLAFINYPNNPTSARAGRELMTEVVGLAARHNMIVANDAAYADVYFDGTPPPLLVEQPGALDAPVIEFFSFSKSFSITGWRVAFAVGRSDIIDALAHLKANIDSNAFAAVQDAVADTLDDDGDAYMEQMRAEYERRRDIALDGLDRLGFQCFPTYATFYVWARVPEDGGSMDYALDVLARANVLVTPGVGFGSGGEGYFRIALTQNASLIESALQRIGSM